MYGSDSRHVMRRSLQIEDHAYLLISEWRILVLYINFTIMTIIIKYTSVLP